MSHDFNDNFSEIYLLTSVPQFLLSMIFVSTVSTQYENDDQVPESFKPTRSISQLIKFNSAHKQSNTTHSRYSAEKDCSANTLLFLCTQK